MALQLLHGQLLQTPPVPNKDLTGWTIIITGANSGLGLDAAKHLYRLNCSHVILACRDLGKGERAKDEILQHSLDLPNVTGTSSSKVRDTTISVWHLDMSSYASVTSFASRAAALPQLHGAVLNAGVALTEFTLSEGIETTLTVNVTSTFLLAVLLIPILRQSSQNSNIIPHITIVGSAIHHFAKQDQLISAATSSTSTSIAQPSILTNLSDPKTASMSDRYFLSKLLVQLLTTHLASLLTRSTTDPALNKIILNSIAPGYCRTSLFRHDETPVSKLALRIIGRSSEEGSRTLVHGVVDAGQDTHGCYVSECRVKKASAFVRGEEGKRIGEMLWEEVVGIAEGVVPGCVANI